VTAADILRAAAHLIEDGTAVTAHGAIRIAVCGGPDEVCKPGRQFNTPLYEQARNTLAAHLPYPAGQNPERLLRRWSNATTRPDMVREMLAAADNADRSL
jgi:hypothetical protein